MEKNAKVATSRRTGKYLVVSIIITIFNFSLYSILARIINNNDLLWVSTLISTAATTILAYILHSKITWKERSPSKTGIYNFFIWNAILTFFIGPFFTWFFTLITPLYDFIFSISSTIHLPFDYNFIQSTSVFIFVSIVFLILNYCLYDKFVFRATQKQTSK